MANENARRNEALGYWLDRIFHPPVPVCRTCKIKMFYHSFRACYTCPSCNRGQLQ